MIEIDGSEGEGGGQILRSSLSLSALTGQPVTIERVRARRSRPGLMRQHLTCVRAAAQVCDARVEGAELGSQRVVFRPGEVRGGTFTFSVGTAGSSVLVAQTVLPPLLFGARRPSRIRFEGGTHNPMAPTFEYFDQTFLGALRPLGVAADAALESVGFYPVGGGAWTLDVRPVSSLEALFWLHRGPIELSAHAFVQKLPFDIVERELAACRDALMLDAVALKPWQPPPGPGYGNAMWIRCAMRRGSALFTALGRRDRPAEQVAADALAAFRRFAAADVPVDEHLADQLLLPLALGAGGTFRTLEPTPHTRSNARVIEAFGVAQVEIEDERDDAARITVTPRECRREGSR